MIKYFFNYVEFLLFKILKAFLDLIGFDNASNLGNYIFKKIGPFTRYYKIIKLNMNLLYKDKKKIETLALENLGQTGKTFFEFLCLNNFDNKKISITNEHHLKEIKNSKKSYFFISAHYGNWEITRNFLLSYGFKLHTVYRHANNKLIDKEIQKIRKMPGAHFYKKGKESAKHMIKALKSNEYLAILIDQKDNSGSQINFFDNKAITNTGFAALALKYQTGICPIRSQRKQNGNFEIIVDKPLLFDEFKNKSQLELTQLIYSRYIEQWIIEDPTQWLWSHRRWK